MYRTLGFACLLTSAVPFLLAAGVASNVVFGADTKPATVKTRKAVVAESQKLYASKLKAIEAELSEGKALLSNRDTAAEGRKIVMVAQEKAMELRVNPFSVHRRLVRSPLAGQVGQLVQPMLLVVENSKDGTLVDMAFRNVDGEALVGRFFLVPPVEGAKSGEKTLQEGLMRSNGLLNPKSETTILQRLDITADEISGTKKK